ncbi:MAG: hypothetical protein ABSD20_13170 [Terriglobales bacterium]|jgi:hypothetical protein
MRIRSVATLLPVLCAISVLGQSNSSSRAGLPALASAAGHTPQRIWTSGYVNATAGSLTFYTLTPCRVVNTRDATGALGGPSLVANAVRSFPMLESSCFSGIAGTPVAYSVNVTVIPKSGGSLGYLTVWPYGQSQPSVSTLNDATGLVLANAAIVPAGSDSEGSVSVYPSSTTATDLLIDVNGYFAAGAGTGTITGVAAGTDLTGGGTSGSVTLNLDTTKVPTLAAASNAFTGSIAASSFTGGGAGLTGVNATFLGGIDAGGYAQLATFNSFTSANNFTTSAADNNSAAIFTNTSAASTTVQMYNDSTAADAGILYAAGTSGSCSIVNAGDLYCTGALNGSAKNFRIDDPLDPANKYLMHSSVESSERMNIYTGNVVLNGQGEAEVRLPDWFEVLNGDFRYQLTPIGAAFTPYIAEEISNGGFTIAGMPGKKVSWQVTGVRHDPWAKANPLQVEQEKPPQERGHYIHPALYGAPNE